MATLRIAVLIEEEPRTIKRLIIRLTRMSERERGLLLLDGLKWRAARAVRPKTVPILGRVRAKKEKG